MIKGLDVGYYQTKDNEKRLFKSAFSYTDKMITGSKHINIDGVDYYVGVGNNTTCSVDKTDSEVTKACTLMNLAMTRESEYFLVCGLPIAVYKQQHEKFKQSILNYNNCNVVFNNEEYKFSIKDALIFPQGAGALYALDNNNSDMIIVDIGSLTIDVALIQISDGTPHISGSDSWFKGIRLLYTSIIERINLEFGLRLDVKDAESILVSGKLYVDGEEMNLDFLQSTMCEYLEPIVDELVLSYPTRTKPMYLCGGGALLLENAIKRRFPNAILIDDSIYANAIGFYKVGLSKFSEYIEAERGVPRVNKETNYSYGIFSRR
jgi:plasmid segregation protein ParM